MIPTNEKDYLDCDEKIRGQNYSCVSFLSPEGLIKKKEAFYFQKFVESFSKSLTQLFDEIEEHYSDKSEQIRIFKETHNVYFNHKEIESNFTQFVSSSGEQLDKEFSAENNFETNVRGLKIRGTYDTLEEAKHRADVLRKMDNEKFSIYIAEVGCWVPWNPNPDSVKDQEFAETELNTLMKNYNDNSENKNTVFNERKEDLMKKIDDKNKEMMIETINEEVDVESEENKEVQIESSDEVDKVLGIEDAEDPWLTSKEIVKDS